MRNLVTAAILCGTLCGIPAYAQFQPAAPLPVPRFSHGAALMADGRVMLAGGIGSTIAVSSSTVIYDPVADAWSIGPSLAAARLDFPLVRLLSGRLLAISGYVLFGGTYEPTAESYDPSANVWSVAGSLSTPRRFHTATVLRDGRALVMGGAGNPIRLAFGG